MKNLFFISLLLLQGCASIVKKEPKVKDKKEIKDIFQTINQNELKFNHLKFVTKVQLVFNKKDYKFSGNILMQKKKAILLEFKFLGIPFSKALITKNHFKFYEKLQKQFYDKDLEFLNEIAGVEVDVNFLQAIILGNSINSLQSKKYKIQSTEDGNYIIFGYLKGIEHKLFIEKASMKVLKQEIYSGNAKMVISYENHLSGTIPDKMDLKIFKDNQSVLELKLSYSRVKFLKNNHYNLEIPKKYHKLEL